MFVLVRSAYDDDDLENLIQEAIDDYEEGSFLDDVKYSTCFDVSNGKILRSALLVFEEYDEDDDEDDDDDEDYDER